MTKEEIEKELCLFFKGKCVAVEQGGLSWQFTAGVQDMIYCNTEQQKGWVLVCAVTDIDLSKNPSSKLAHVKQELEWQLQQVMNRTLNGVTYG